MPNQQLKEQSVVSLLTGRQMPVIGLGTWKLVEDTAHKVQTALDLGYRMIDTSSDYHTQPGIGQALKKTLVERDQIFLTSKVEETEEDSYRAVELCLAEMDQDYVNLIVIHRPPTDGSGEKIWEGLIMAREAGLTWDIGVSNYSTDQIDDLIKATDVVPVVNQIEWTPFGHSQKMMDYCAEKNILIQAYSPLTRTEKFENKTLQEIADKYEKSPAQILIRWNLQKGSVPIPKADQLVHMEENLEVFDFHLTDEEMDSLSTLNEHYSALGDTLEYLAA